MISYRGAEKKSVPYGTLFLRVFTHLHDGEELDKEQRGDHVGQNADILSLAGEHLDKGVGDEAEADGVAERGSFIVNPEGKIVAYEVNAGNVGRNADELLRKVQACQFVAEHGDEVCPAKWQPGAETLKPSLDLVGQL